MMMTMMFEGEGCEGTGDAEHGAVLDQEERRPGDG